MSKRHTSRRKPRPPARRRRPVTRASASVTWDDLSKSPHLRQDNTREDHALTWRIQVSNAVQAISRSSRWISLFILVATATALYLLGSRPQFIVNRAAVSADNSSSTVMVAEASEVDGVHIFFIDPHQVADRVAGLPNIQSAAVNIAWPNRVLVVANDRQPVLVWVQKGGRYWIDEDGVFMHARGGAAGLVTVTCEDDVPVHIGDRLPDGIVEAALQVNELKSGITALSYTGQNGLAYDDPRQFRVYLGYGPDMNQKLAVVDAIVEDLMSRGLRLEYLSVMNTEKPFYKLI